MISYTSRPERGHNEGPRMPIGNRKCLCATVVALWTGLAATWAGWLPVSTPPRLDWLLGGGLVVVTAESLYGVVVRKAFRAGIAIGLSRSRFVRDAKPGQQLEDPLLGLPGHKSVEFGGE